MVWDRLGFWTAGKAVEEGVSGTHDFENEFQFQLQGYASAAQSVNPEPHKLV
jgi:hypothetical protein